MTALRAGLRTGGRAQASSIHSSFSLLVGKIQGTIVDYLQPPLSTGELLAALVGGGGLGRIVNLGFGQQDHGVILAGAVLVAALALRYAGRRVPREVLRAAWPGEPRLVERLLGPPGPRAR